MANPSNVVRILEALANGAKLTRREMQNICPMIPMNEINEILGDLTYDKTLRLAFRDQGSGTVAAVYALVDPPGERWEKTVGDLYRLMAEKDNVISNLRKQLYTFQQSLSSEIAVQGQLRKEKGDLEKAYKALEDSFNSYWEKSRSDEKDLLESRRHETRLKEQLAQANQQIDSLQQQVLEREGEVNTLQDAVKSRDLSLGTQRKEIAGLKQVEAESKELGEEKEQYRTDFLRIAGEREQLKEKLASLQKREEWLGRTMIESLEHRERYVQSEKTRLEQALAVQKGVSEGLRREKEAALQDYEERQRYGPWVKEYEWRSRLRRLNQYRKALQNQAEKVLDLRKQLAGDEKTVTYDWLCGAPIWTPSPTATDPPKARKKAKVVTVDTLQKRINRVLDAIEADLPDLPAGCVGHIDENWIADTLRGNV